MFVKFYENDSYFIYLYYLTLFIIFIILGGAILSVSALR